MKRVSFKVAKAIKEAGYPQDELENPDSHWFYDEETKCNILRVTYLEVWLWLWREKKICINCNYDKYNFPPMWWCNNEDRINYNTPNFDDPEEAIIAAIEYLVDNRSL